MSIFLEAPFGPVDLMAEDLEIVLPTPRHHQLRYRPLPQVPSYSR